MTETAALDSIVLPFGPDLWLVDGPIVSAALGFRYPTRMALIRLPDASLLVWSPVALSARLIAWIERSGPVAHVVAPNHLHHLFLRDWQDAYPAAKLYAAPQLRAKRPDIRFDADLADGLPQAWGETVACVLFAGNAIMTEAVLFHRPSATVIFTDLLQQVPADLNTGWRGWIARADRMTGTVPQVPHKFRLATTDRDMARASLAAIQSWPAERLVFAHGPPVDAGARDRVRSAFAWLA